jgi:hypothetical protein
MNSEDNDKEYFAYGHYGYYKKKILERMFAISNDISAITTICSTTQYNKKQLSTSDVNRMYLFISNLKIAITELSPKLNSIKKKQDQYNIKDINEIIKIPNKDLIYNYELLFDYYTKYVNLIEALGYSDMNVVQSATDSWGDNTNDFNPYL